MRTFAACLMVSALALVGCGESNETAAPEKPADPAERKTAEVPEYSAEAFFETTSYGLAAPDGHAFAPDDGRLLVTSDETGVYNAYALDPETGKRQALTESESDAVSGLSWFPGDGRVLFTRDQGGNELNHVFVREEDGATRDLTPGEKLKAGFVGWAADGDAFYLQSNERDSSYFDVYRYDAGDYEREMIYENTQGHEPAEISPDGRWLALEKTHTNRDSDLYLVDLESDEKEPRLITEHEGDVNHSVMTFTPDSKGLVYGTNEHGEFTQAWSHDLESGEKSPLIEADWDVMYVAFSPEGRYRVHAVNRDARTDATILDTETGREVEIPDLPEGNLRNIRFNSESDRMAFLLERDTSPPNVYVADLPEGPGRKLTDALNPEIAEEHLVEGRVVRFESYDGLEIPGILYRPQQASKGHAVPALVWVHGGPGGQSRKGYSPVIQHLVNHGYAVYAINNRGSSGYGKTFFHLDDKKHGEADLGDVVASRDFLASHDWIDGGKIGVIGGSYGGYMVAAALAFEPEAFDVGVNIFGVTNWVRTLKQIPDWWEARRDALYDELGDPGEEEERLRRISPLFHAENIVRPLLVVQGANDPRVKKVESDELVEAVRANDVPVEYVVFEDEGHGFRNRDNRIEASEAYVDFLDEHLKGESPAADSPQDPR